MERLKVGNPKIKEIDIFEVFLLHSYVIIL
jgi:hypothetical protein